MFIVYLFWRCQLLFPGHCQVNENCLADPNVTVVNDLTTSEPRVLYVAAGRAGTALDGYFDGVGEADCGRIQMVAMDMWPAYIRSVREHTEVLIAFDKFHVAQQPGAAVDKVRRSENRALRQQGDDRLGQ